ncbi:MAG: glycosyltransferase family 9 protein [Sphingobacteriaceae bacterium]|nr:glycosyltransferase family 9 protein [Sphingobacteriaceae bacterium]
MTQKILVIRFSSIGDIVLTTPIIRCIKQQKSDVELHYVTKKVFGSILQSNQYIDKLHVFEKDVVEITKDLNKENFDLIIDLHHNLRSLRLITSLGKPSHCFNKLNFRKFMAVNFKQLGMLPNVHIVERYFETVKTLGVVNDHKGLDHFISKEDEFDITKKFTQLSSPNFIALVVGGSYYTKKIPLTKLIEICNSTTKQFIVLGSKDDDVVAKQLQAQCSNVINACGELSLNQSAYVIKLSESVVTSDTGLMHIASAFNKKIISLWGNTIPEFGMYPYLPSEGSKIMEVKGLACRPCSKLGYKACPKSHFKCMNDIDVSQISL